MKFNKICILGLGYIGLPTASLFAIHGLDVIGVDINPKVLDTLKEGRLHIKEDGLDELVRNALGSGKLDLRLAPDYADVFIIAVPTPIKSDKTADLSMVVSAAQMILPYLRPGNLVILESTSPPRTTVGLVQPILEQHGLAAGIDFSLAYSPERVLPGGQLLREMRENARVIGGVDHASAEAGHELYATFVTGEIMLTDATTAEMVKLMENTYRDVNIALANEFALVSEAVGTNVWEAIELANKHPRVKILRPGPGVGGHCIAVDPWFLVEVAPDLTPIIRSARTVNDSMPHNVSSHVKQLVPVGGRVVVLGLAYKANIDDIRESPAIETVKLLISDGFDVRICDPFVSSDLAHALLGLRLTDIGDAVKDADCLLLLTEHNVYRHLKPGDYGHLMRTRVVIDTRGTFDANNWAKAGFEIAILGRGWKGVAQFA